MMAMVRRIKLNEREHALLVNALYATWKAWKNEGQATEDMEELILKVIDAPQKKSLWRC